MLSESSVFARQQRHTLFKGKEKSSRHWNMCGQFDCMAVQGRNTQGSSFNKITMLECNMHVFRKGQGISVILVFL